MDGDEKLYIGTVVKSKYAFTVFASKFVIDFIEKNIEPSSRKYLMDATFDSLPKDFYQLLIISIEYQNDVSNIFFNYIYLIITLYTYASSARLIVILCFSSTLRHSLKLQHILNILS